MHEKGGVEMYTIVLWKLEWKLFKCVCESVKLALQDSLIHKHISATSIYTFTVWLYTFPHHPSCTSYLKSSTLCISVISTAYLSHQSSVNEEKHSHFSSTRKYIYIYIYTHTNTHQVISTSVKGDGIQTIVWPGLYRLWSIVPPVTGSPLYR